MTEPSTTTTMTTPTPAADAAVPAAPAISAPAEPTPGQRPTFEQAFAADAAAEPPASAAPPPDPAATLPAAPEGDPTAPTHPSAKTGPIPFDVHKTALDNARTKATAEAQASFDRDYGWAKQVSPATVERWSGIASLMASDPSAFLEKYFAEAAQHPTHGAQVKSWAAKTLASRGTAPAPDLSPDVVVQDANGREVARTFSAERVQALLQAAVGKELAPLKQDLQTRQDKEKQWQEAARQAEVTQRLESATDAVFADISELLDISEQTPQATKDALFSELTALLDADEKLTPHKAAMQLRKTRIVPALQGQAQKKVLDELTSKAGAQAMNPQRTSVAPAHRPRSFNDPTLKW